jgi:betaine-homocysteine S-methyltransferase
MFEEQVAWAAAAGADFIVGETFSYGEEALIALEAIRAAGLPAVMTMAVHRRAITRDGWTPEETCKRLADAGADVVGLNCSRGPRTLLPYLVRVREAVDTHVAALPVPYRTTESEPTFQSLHDPEDLAPDGRAFPTALDPFLCNRYEIAEFTREASALGVRYLGLCCGGAPHFVRSMAEALGRRPPASRYSPDMSKHAFMGTDDRLLRHNREYAGEL